MNLLLLSCASQLTCWCLTWPDHRTSEKGHSAKVADVDAASADVLCDETHCACAPDVDAALETLGNLCLASSRVCTKLALKLVAAVTAGAGG